LGRGSLTSKTLYKIYLANEKPWVSTFAFVVPLLLNSQFYALLCHIPSLSNIFVIQALGCIYREREGKAEEEQRERNKEQE